ncbi:MAG: elongation factor G [Clostridiales bacterium]|nr:elongation factor G [Clostridiales bacterium]
MASYNKEKIRNIALIGHGGEGKTSLLEAMLFNTKAIDRLGKVDDGTTVSDYDAEEIARKMSIGLSVSNVKYKDYKINVIDTPGFFDFEGEMISALSVADGAIVVTQAHGYLSVGTEKAISYCLEKKIPMMIFVNGVNKENSDYFKTVDAIKQKYGNMIAAIEYPIMDGNTITGYVDVVAQKAFDVDFKEIDIPQNFVDMVAEGNNELAETAAGASEELMESFFDKGELSAEEKAAGIKILVGQTELIPVISGVVVGKKPFLADLLDLIINFVPTAGESVPVKAMKDNEEIVIECDENAPFACHVFKTIVDPFVGKLLIFKAYAGSVKSGDVVYNTNKDETEKISALYILNGKQQIQTDVIKAGDIGAFAKLSYTSTNDTLCDNSRRIAFAPIEFPKPVYTLAIVADEKGGADKVVEGLRKLMDEDHTFFVGKDMETGETVVRGMGETQIDVLLKKVKNKYKVEAVLTEPRVAYRETIRKQVSQQGRCKKQTGGSGLFGDVHIRFEPAPEVEDFEFGVEVVGGAVPRQFYPAVEKGLREIKVNGVLAGYPLVNFRAVLYDGSHHPVDSKEAAFIEAAKIAYREGIPKANPVLLEPIVSIKVTVPTEFMGDIMGDITKRRGRIFGMDNQKDMTVVSGEVPQSELTRYAIDLRSMTQGRGRFSTEFARYEEVPSSHVAKIIEDSKR